MIRKQNTQQKLELVSIESLVPADHLLRKIDRAIDFSFIREKVKSLYCQNNGRPGVDPVVLFKMLFIGYLFGIRSERQLIKEIEVNIAYRWFLGYGLEDKIPHHSTISQNRRRRFSQSNIYQEIFDTIVWLAIEKKMVDGKTLYTDSTHLKANANKHKFKRKEVTHSTRKYIKDLDEDIQKDRANHDKRPLKPKEEVPDSREIKESTTDPDSGYMHRDGKPKGFFYLDHRSVDGKHNIITDTFITGGNIHDSIPYLERLDYQREKFGFVIESVGLDAGYNTASICKGLEDRGIYGVIGYNRPRGKKGKLRKRDFKYDAENDLYICPGNQKLFYRTTTRAGYREYASNASLCKSCLLLEQCTSSRNHQKIVTRHIWQDYKEKVDRHRLEDRGKAIYQRRKETIERSFADAKQLHGYRYARMRGLSKVQEQAFLTAACQNMKKIALYLSRLAQNGGKKIYCFIMEVKYRYKIKLLAVYI
ncbi:MAG: IS1182 family transposase [Calditrichia bacterium]